MTNPIQEGKIGGKRMLLPTEDGDLRLFLESLPVSIDHEEGKIFLDDLTVLGILRYIEKKGYHKGLPRSIVEALNSGDGVYRP